MGSILSNSVVGLWWKSLRTGLQDRIQASERRQRRTRGSDFATSDPVGYSDSAADWTTLAKNLNTKSARQAWIARAYYLYHNNGLFKNAIQLCEKYLAGPGFIISSLKPQQQKAIDQFILQSNFQLRKYEIIRRLFRDGEVFILLELKDNPKLFSFINPISVYSPTSQVQDLSITDGIRFDEYNNPVSYFIDGEEVDAENILHWKLSTDEDEARGLSPFISLAPVAQSIVEFAAFRMAVNQNAGMWVMHEQASYQDSGGHPTWNVLQPGQVVTTDTETQLKILSADTQATNAAQDFRTLGLLTAISQGLPEFMATGDAANANYSSTQIAYGSAIKTFEYWQEIIDCFFRQLFTIVLEHEGHRTPDLTIEFPSIVASDQLPEAQAAMLYKQLGASNHTLLSMLGFDPDEEARYKEDEKPAAPEVMPVDPNLPVPVDQNQEVAEEEIDDEAQA